MAEQLRPVGARRLAGDVREQERRAGAERLITHISRRRRRRLARRARVRTVRLCANSAESPAISLSI